MTCLREHHAKLALATLVAPLGPFDRVSAGFPGVVFDGIVKDAPNLHLTWARVGLADRLARLFKRPARVLNDAGIQGFGIIKGAECRTRHSRPWATRADDGEQPSLLP